MFEDRPEPVTLIAIYQFMNGAILLVLSCTLALAAAPAFMITVGAIERVALVTLIGAGALSLMIVFGTASLTVGWGLLRLRPWARLGAIVLAIFGLIVFPLWTIASALVLIYLISPEARVAFGLQPDEDEPDEPDQPATASPVSSPATTRPPAAPEQPPRRRIITPGSRVYGPQDNPISDPERTRAMPAIDPGDRAKRDPEQS